MNPEESTYPNLAFVKRVESLRHRKGWTLERVAKEIGLSRTMLHFIKTGKHGVTDGVLHRLSQVEVEAGKRVATTEEEQMAADTINAWIAAEMRRYTPEEKIVFLTIAIRIASEHLRQTALERIGVA